MKLTLVRILLFSSFFLFAGAGLASDWVVLGGTEVGSQGDAYIYAGGISPLPESSLGKGWHQRWWLDWLKYSYDSNNTDVTAEAPGVQASLGYQAPAPVGNWALYGGLGYRHTHLSPDQPDADNRGSQLSAFILAEANQTLAKDWRFAEGAVLDSEGNYWARVKGGKRIDSHGVSYGASAAVLGGNDYQITKLALNVDEIKISKDLSVNFGVGIADTEGLGSSEFLLAELVYLYMK